MYVTIQLSNHRHLFHNKHLNTPANRLAGTFQAESKREKILYKQYINIQTACSLCNQAQTAYYQPLFLVQHSRKGFRLKASEIAFEVPVSQT